MDIAIMVSEPMDGFERVDLETQLSNLVGKDVDLIVFGSASPLLQHQVLKYGVLIYEGDCRERVRQEVGARRDYLDTRYLYKFIEGNKRNKRHGGQGSGFKKTV